MSEQIQYSFKRHEIKFLLEPDMFRDFYPELQKRMTEDLYGKYSIHNIYYDTPDYLLIRRSLDKPVYKEKFRLRSYGLISADDAMFAEIKKKYKGIVYKRRIVLPGREFEHMIHGDKIPDCDFQIQQEIIQFFHTYQNLEPKAYISYDRIALAGVGEDSTLRVTFDQNISFREKNLFLWSEGDVMSVLPNEKIVMEIKVDHAVPLWLVSLLSEFKIYKCSFSKYGTYYTNYIAKELQERMKHNA